MRAFRFLLILITLLAGTVALVQAGARWLLPGDRPAVDSQDVHGVLLVSMGAGVIPLVLVGALALGVAGALLGWFAGLVAVAWRSSER
jgi:hypothetical protein